MSLREKAQKILSRKIKNCEGFDILTIEKIEKKLNIILPKALKEFYLFLGKNKLFTEGHQRFLDLNQLAIKNNKLLFLEENQCACYWAVDLLDNKTVYQSTDISFKEYYAEEFTLLKFIEMMLYFQCVMASDYLHQKYESGYSYSASLDMNDSKEIEREILQELQTNYYKVLSGNGLSIYSKEDAIIIAFLNEYEKIEHLFTCCKNEKYFDFLIDKYYFMEL